MRCDLTRDREPQLTEVCHLGTVHQGESETGAPSGHDADSNCLLSRQTSRLKTGDQLFLRDPAEMNCPATRCDGCWKVVL